jgi:hypothetical protein
MRPNDFWDRDSSPEAVAAGPQPPDPGRPNSENESGYRKRHEHSRLVLLVFFFIQLLDVLSKTTHCTIA